MTEAAHTIRWSNWDKQRMESQLEDFRPKEIGRYWDENVRHEVTVFEPRFAAGDMR